MTYEKALYFVARDKKVNHIGFFNNLSEIFLLESRELLKEKGFEENSLFLRETADSAFLFSSFLSQSLIDRWFSQIRDEQAKLRRRDSGNEKENKGEEVRERQRNLSRVKKHHKKKRQSRIHSTRKKSSPANTKRALEIQAMKKRKTLFQPLTKIQKRRKTLEVLREEVKAQRLWEGQVPTCGECAFYENQYLLFTQEEAGGCKVTGNFVSSEKKACSEFERP
ncbi:MAG: hypothetical protein HXS44_07205 [Theionarchaea archaeon]|nr:hypothetical protein [Theionarchaea archaeon]